MDYFQQAWIEELKAAAQQIVDEADAIVGDLHHNMQLKVIIKLSSGTEKPGFPTLTIKRKIVPIAATHKFIEMRSRKRTGD